MNKRAISQLRGNCDNTRQPQPRLGYPATVTATIGIRKFQAEIKCRKPRKAVLARHGGLDIAGEADLRDIAPLGILDMEDGEWTDIQTDVMHKSQDESIEMSHLLFYFTCVFVQRLSLFSFLFHQVSFFDSFLICLAFFSASFSFK